MKEGRKREKNIHRLPLAHPHPGTWPTAQAWLFDLQAGAQSTEPHQPGKDKNVLGKSLYSSQIPHKKLQPYTHSHQQMASTELGALYSPGCDEALLLETIQGGEKEVYSCSYGK